MRAITGEKSERLFFRLESALHIGVCTAFEAAAC